MACSSSTHPPNLIRKEGRYEDVKGLLGPQPLLTDPEEEEMMDIPAELPTIKHTSPNSLTQSTASSGLKKQEVNISERRSKRHITQQ